MASEPVILDAEHKTAQKLDHPSRFGLHFRETILAYIFIFPSLLFTFLFGIYPVLSGLWQSLRRGTPIPTEYVGLDQYIRSIGSLIYVVIILLSVVFCYLAYGAWQRLRQEPSEAPKNSAWFYLVPGFLLSLGLLISVVVLVIGGYGYSIWEVGEFGISVVWVGVGLMVLAAAGYYALLSSSNKNRKGIYIVNSWLVMFLTLMAVLLVRYAYSQLDGDVENARRVAAHVLRTDVGNAQPLRPVSGGQFTGVDIGSVPVQVQVGDRVYDAVLSPDAYSHIDLNRVTTDATLNFTNQQNIEVVMPLARGFGLPPVDFKVQGQLVLERDSSQIGIGGGAPTLEVPIELSDSSVQAPYDILFPGDVGDAVIRRSGYTVPVKQPFMAAVAVAFCLGAVLLMGQSHRRMSEDNRWYNWLVIGRVLLWLVVAGLVIYIVSQVQFYRSTGLAIQRLSQEQFSAAYEYSTGQTTPRTLFRDDVVSALMFFPQIISISAGALLIVAAYMIWNGAKDRETGLGTASSILFAVFLMVGGWLCIGELPATLSLAGRSAIESRDAMIRTALFSLGTVPTQLAFGLLLAYLMFYEVTTGKGIFRLIYFMPYITPQIATATVFTVIFSISPNGLANQFLNLFGIGDQLWLKEGSGIFRVLYAEIFNGNPQHIPALFQGPSLALTTVILFNIWVYAGYNSVIFLAGLGSIPTELYEAARVDGAGRWSAFRHITFPLLSPVTFFLSILSIIGTFKAFGSVYVIRDDGNNYADTFTVEIFNAMKGDGNRGYAAALAFVLFGVILVLTLVQNRLSRERVFYG